MNTRHAIIDLLLSHGALSRVQIAHAAHLSKPTVATAVEQLITDGIVHEVGFGISTGGRKPVLVRIGGDGKVAVGIEIDSRLCKIALVNLGGSIVDQVNIAVTDRSVESIIRLVAASVGRLFAGRDRKALVGCGVGIPGLIDAAQDSVNMAPSLGWTNVPLKALLEAALQVPVSLIDRGKAGALGEAWLWGRDRREDLIYIYLGNGVGGGIILGRSLHQGLNHTAGEIGHMIIDPRGPLCDCGNHGCLESFVSGPAIARQTRAYIRAGHLSILTDWNPGNNLEAITTKQIADAALAGDRLALKMLHETAIYVGIAIANLVNVLNPSVVVLGGPVSRWGTLLLDATREEVRKRALAIPFQSTNIMLSQSDSHVVPLGAAALVLHNPDALLAAT
ncbi:MAG: ROK family transcriptional regulator [Herpetosiphon sp.]